MSQWGPMKQFLAEYLQMEQQYKAGALYQAFEDQYGAVTTRKDFEMFLRYEVLKDDGCLKRTAHGIYELRTDPHDRGVLFKRDKSPVASMDPMDDILYRQYRIDPTKESFDDILDDALRLTARVRALLAYTEETPSLWLTERKELDAIRKTTLKSMDDAVSGLTAAMAWCEDHLEEAQTVEEQNAGMVLM